MEHIQVDLKLKKPTLIDEELFKEFWGSYRHEFEKRVDKMDNDLIHEAILKSMKSAYKSGFMNGLLLERSKRA